MVDLERAEPAAEGRRGRGAVAGPPAAELRRRGSLEGGFGGGEEVRGGGYVLGVRSRGSEVGEVTEGGGGGLAAAHGGRDGTLLEGSGASAHGFGVLEGWSGARGRGIRGGGAGRRRHFAFEWELWLDAQLSKFEMHAGLGLHGSLHQDGTIFSIFF
jgi:hypothetical protein